MLRMKFLLNQWRRIDDKIGAICVCTVPTSAIVSAVCGPHDGRGQGLGDGPGQPPSGRRGQTIICAANRGRMEGCCRGRATFVCLMMCCWAATAGWGDGRGSAFHLMARRLVSLYRARDDGCGKQPCHRKDGISGSPRGVFSHACRQQAREPMKRPRFCRPHTKVRPTALPCSKIICIAFPCAEWAGSISAQPEPVTNQPLSVIWRMRRAKPFLRG